jgi:hypothetical protein
MKSSRHYISSIGIAGVPATGGWSQTASGCLDYSASTSLEFLPLAGMAQTASGCLVCTQLPLSLEFLPLAGMAQTASGWNGSNSLWLFNPKQKHTPHSLIQSSEFLPSGKNQLALMYN